ncbi:MAG: hypothetical protein R3Y05_06085 [bacterium]
MGNNEKELNVQGIDVNLLEEVMKKTDSGNYSDEELFEIYKDYFTELKKQISKN